MNKLHLFYRNPSASLLAIAVAALLAMPGTALAAAAGRAVFVSGAPQAINQAGTTRALKRGDDVFSGDELTTPNGSRLQVSFADGAYISLQPDSEYVIEQYNFSGQQDGTERASYRLLKGGVRAITGLVGKKNPDAYKVQTPVATIGIRGTGHNTRICAGDCPGKSDGLYHNTWEGITFVVNDVDSKEVPTGSGVFVEGLDKPIEFLDQPPGVTAVDTGTAQEEEQEEEEDQQSAFQVGDQRTEDGDQVIIPGGTSTVTSGLKLGGVGAAQDTDNEEGYEDVESGDAAIFVRDSDGLVVGLLLVEDNEEGDDDGSGSPRPLQVSSTHLTAATIDLDAVRGGDDADVVSEASRLLGLADPATVAFFQENPAHVEDQFFDDGLGLFRWTGGRFLVSSESEDGVQVIELEGHQSFHFIFGPAPPPIPTSGHAVYDFIGGTSSTSASGATLGKGVIGGQISVDFAGGAANLAMDVDHNNLLYHVGGLLDIGGDDGDVNAIYGDVLASTASAASGSACYPSCMVVLEGGFAGPTAAGRYPGHIGFQYAIMEHDPIIGVAGFGFTAQSGSKPAGH